MFAVKHLKWAVSLAKIKKQGQNRGAKLSKLVATNLMLKKSCHPKLVLSLDGRGKLSGVTGQADGARPLPLAFTQLFISSAEGLSGGQAGPVGEEVPALKVDDRKRTVTATTTTTLNQAKCVLAVLAQVTGVPWRADVVRLLGCQRVRLATDWAAVRQLREALLGSQGVQLIEKLLSKGVGAVAQGDGHYVQCRKDGTGSGDLKHGNKVKNLIGKKW